MKKNPKKIKNIRVNVRTCFINFSQQKFIDTTNTNAYHKWIDDNYVAFMLVASQFCHEKFPKHV